MRLRNIICAGRFPVAAVSVFGLMLVAQNVTSIGLVFNTTFVLLLAVTFLPLLLYVGVFTLVLSPLVFICFICDFLGLSGPSGFKIYEAVADGIGPYYRWLFGITRPLLWGACFGATIGLAALWAITVGIRQPGEQETKMILTRVRDAVIKQFEETGKLPPRTERQLLCRDICIERDGFVTDSFGRPLDYDVREPTFRLRSMGYDGRPGADDLCMIGRVERPDQEVAPETTASDKPENEATRKIAEEIGQEITSKFGLEFDKNKVQIRIGSPDSNADAREFNELMCPQK
ncbi:MAG: hypothetical protein JWN70_4896 [Planctomycetaceae bacterium]|nr:hypothetical protein [Planctomycetaceae bacterium]